MKPLKPTDPPRIGPFRIVARLGAGGMGTVYLGRAESTGKAVAIKTIHGDLVTDREFRARFAREVSAARQVRGTYIAEVVDADAEAANPWLATAYSPGISVGDAVHRSGVLPEEAVRKLGLCVARAVADIHAVGLVHRDLKPDNILLTSIGPKVIDFGIARGLSEEGLTRTGMVAGSPPYMAPEQLLTGDFGTGSDVFGLAAILHFAATGIGPYGKGGVNELYGRAITIGPVLDETLPASLAEPLRSCLTKEPAGRPDAAGLALMLEQSPDEDPGTGWLPSAVMAEILAQATEALSAESSGGAPVPPPVQQQRPQQPPPYVAPRPAPQQGYPGPTRPPLPAPQYQQPGPPQQHNRPQAGPQRPPNWPNNAPQGNNPAVQGGSGSGPNWSLGGGRPPQQQPPQQQPGPTRPPLPAPQYQPQQQRPNTPPPRPVVNTPPRPVVATPPPFGVQHPANQQRPPYGQPNPYAVATGRAGYAPPRNLKATWAMVLALVSVPGLIIPFLNVVLAATAIILGVNGNALANRNRIGKNQAMTGIILGSVMVILAIWVNIYEIKTGAFNSTSGS
ncbi:MAG TPA: protein kinase [Actinocrinis sp.]|nr:protein kinase [Actinocrinis sp.]